MQTIQLKISNTDFQITEFEYTRILSPREYWDSFDPKKE
jgi:hypothetical protein